MRHLLPLTLRTLSAVAALAWSLPGLRTASPAEAITTFFLGTLTQATPDPGPADALFTALAAQAASSIDVAMYDFNRTSVGWARRGKIGRRLFLLRPGRV